MKIEEIFYDTNFKAEKITAPKIYEQIKKAIEKQEEILKFQESNPHRNYFYLAP